MLSRKVKLETDLFDNETVEGISLVINREAENKTELSKEIDDTLKNIIHSKEKKGTTTFTYELKTNQNKEAARLGLEEFIKNISKVIIFSKVIKTAKLFVDGKTSWTEYEGNEITFENKSDESFNGHIHVVQVNETGNKCSKTHRFLVASHKCTFNDECKRKYEVIGMVEVKLREKKIDFDNSQNDSMVYIKFPVIGFESFVYPFYIHSNMFHPTTERDELHLKNAAEENGKLTEYGENRAILEESVKIFEDIVKYCANHKYLNMYSLLKGLDPSKIDNKLFDENSIEWYKTNIIKKFQDIILNILLFKSKKGFIIYKTKIKTKKLH